MKKFYKIKFQKYFAKMFYFISILLEYRYQYVKISLSAKK